MDCTIDKPIGKCASTWDTNEKKLFDDGPFVRLLSINKKK